MYICQETSIYLIRMPLPAGRTRNPRGQGERLRTTLMDAARELLLELGDQDKLSVRAITARAGVSPNALYLHFADKDELLSALMIAELQGTARLPARGRLAGRLRRSSCARSGSRYIEFATQRPGIYRVPVHDQAARGRADARAGRAVGRGRRRGHVQRPDGDRQRAACRTDRTRSPSPRTCGRGCTATSRSTRRSPRSPAVTTRLRRAHDPRPRRGRLESRHERAGP